MKLLKSKRIPFYTGTVFRATKISEKELQEYQIALQDNNRAKCMLTALNFFSTTKNKTEALSWIGKERSNALLIIETCSAEY